MTSPSSSDAAAAPSDVDEATALLTAFKDSTKVDDDGTLLFAQSGEPVPTSDMLLAAIGHAILGLTSALTRR